MAAVSRLSRVTWARSWTSSRVGFFIVRLKTWQVTRNLPDILSGDKFLFALKLRGGASAVGQFERTRNFAGVWIAGRLIGIKQGSSIFDRTIRQRPMHQERVEIRNAACRYFERHEA